MNSFSVVLCTYNRLELLKQSLEALQNLDYENFEIIVINDNSSDKTREYLESLDSIKIFNNAENLGLARSRNKGAELAKFENIAFTDDDCLVDKNWLKNFDKKFEEKKVDFVYGQTIYLRENYKGHFPERVIQNLDASWPGGGNIAYKKQVFNKVGGFKHEYYLYNNEDSEMAIRAVQAGFKGMSAPEAKIYHQKTFWTVKSLLNSAKNASVWVKLKKEYPDYYFYFNPPVKFGFIINVKDYFYIIFLLVILPILFIRFLYNGQRDFKLFFTKWPVYLFVRRWYIYKEVIKNRVWMI